MVRPEDGRDCIRVFQFMRANQAVCPVAMMARVLGVSTAGYYVWVRRSSSARATADAELLKRIRTVHATSHGTSGAPRVHAALLADGQRHGRKRIARLMRMAGLVGVSRRRGVVTTRRDKDARPAPDLVDRDCTAERASQLWVADITYIPTSTGFLYLAVVLDAWSRRIVGWAMEHICAQNWCGRAWIWQSLNANRLTSFITAIRAANTPPWHSAAGAAKPMSARR